MRNNYIFNVFSLLGFFLLYAVDLSDSWFLANTRNSIGEFHNVSVRYRRQANCDFRCTSGDCVDADALCDGKTDCRDGSDETKAQCQDIQCPSFLFQCKYGACIQKNQVCDGKKHCADNSDEEPPNCNTERTTGTCSNSEYRCNDASCIDNLNTCDGKIDCPDGSDETEEACTGLVCQSYLFRCSYGACVSNSAKCNGVRDCADGSDEVGCGPTEPVIPPVTPTPPIIAPSSGCILPSHIPHGKFELVPPGAVYKENTIVSSSTLIRLQCDGKYVHNAAGLFFCMDNKWSPDIKQADCIRICDPLKESDTYSAVCKYSGRVVNCSNSVEGTTADITCNPFYIYQAIRPILVCRDGTWDPFPAPCDPECGQKIVNAETLIIGGSNALPGEYPWIVAIYNNESKHICGGTIISRFFIVSAAHCFADQEGVPFNESLYTIAAGKYYRDLNKIENGSQLRKIKRLLVHEDYKGRLTKYRDDIALLEVEKLEMSNQVQPVCVDWNNDYEQNDFVENNKAVVAGWGKTLEGSSPAEVLKKLIVPFRMTEVCKQYMDPNFFAQYYSSDKICAGYKDEGSSVCSGDSGGGLYFNSTSTTFYVRAVVSLAPRSQTGCDSNHYALYTKLSRYLQWMSTITLKRV